MTTKSLAGEKKVYSFNRICSGLFSEHIQYFGAGPLCPTPPPRYINGFDGVTAPNIFGDKLSGKNFTYIQKDP